MKRIAIILVSEQTIPNILFLKEMEEFSIADFYFISTKEMEVSSKKKSEVIKRVGGLGNVVKVIVPADDVTAILESLDENIQIDDDACYMVNITAGTKAMALAVYDFFRQRVSPGMVEFFYVPIGKSFMLKIFPKFGKLSVDAKLNLKEYLAAYGREIKEQVKLSAVSVKEVKVAEDLFRDASRRKVKSMFSTNQHRVGNLLELYVACFIQKKLNLSDDDIGIRVKISHAFTSDSSSLEYDVAYVKNNRLFLVECKCFKEAFKKSRINEEWYKLAGVKSRLGLDAVSFFVIANKIDEQEKKKWNDYSKLFGLKGLLDIKDIQCDKFFEEFLKNILS